LALRQVLPYIACYKLYIGYIQVVLGGRWEHFYVHFITVTVVLVYLNAPNISTVQTDTTFQYTCVWSLQFMLGQLLTWNVQDK